MAQKQIRIVYKKGYNTLLTLTHGTLKHKLLQWMKGCGRTYSEIELQAWLQSHPDSGMTAEQAKYAGKQRGYWSVHLTCGKDSILHGFCKKIGQHWYLDDHAYAMLKALDAKKARADGQVVQSALESVTATDEIKGNSTVISKEIIAMPGWDKEPEPTVVKRVVKNDTAPEQPSVRLQPATPDPEIYRLQKKSKALKEENNTLGGKLTTIAGQMAALQAAKDEIDKFIRANNKEIGEIREQVLRML